MNGTTEMDIENKWMELYESSVNSSCSAAKLRLTSVRSGIIL